MSISFWYGLSCTLTQNHALKHPSHAVIRHPTEEHPSQRRSIFFPSSMSGWYPLTCFRFPSMFRSSHSLFGCLALAWDYLLLRVRFLPFIPHGYVPGILASCFKQSDDVILSVLATLSYPLSQYSRYRVSRFLLLAMSEDPSVMKLRSRAIPKALVASSSRSKPAKRGWSFFFSLRSQSSEPLPLCSDSSASEEATGVEPVEG